MKKKISVIVPCFNEEENLIPLVKRIEKVLQYNKIKGEIILVNDGSTDDTQKIIENLKKKYSDVKAVSHKKNRGIVASWKTGLELSKGDYILIIDADLQYQPDNIPRLYKKITEHNLINKKCIVQGYRKITNKRKTIRYFLSKLLCFILNILFSMNLKDNKSGFLICKRSIFKDILNYKYRYNYFQHFIMVAANKKDYKIIQIPVKFEERCAGKAFISPLPIKFVLKTIVDFPKAYIEFKK